MTTLRKLIKGSMRLINVIGTGEEPAADDMKIALKSLDGLVQSMGNDILNIYTVQPYYFPLTPGQQHYTLGPGTNSKGELTGADWQIERPMRIEQARLLLYPSITYPAPPAPAPGPPPPPPGYVQHLYLSMNNGFSTSSEYGALAQDGMSYVSLGPVGFNQAAELWGGTVSDSAYTLNDWTFAFDFAFGSWVLRSTTKFSAGTEEAPFPHPQGSIVNGTPTDFAQPSLSQVSALVPAKAGDNVYLRENFFGFIGDQAIGGPDKIFEAVFVVGPNAFNGELYRIVSYYTGDPTGGQVAIEHLTSTFYQDYGVTPRTLE